MRSVTFLEYRNHLCIFEILGNGSAIPDALDQRMNSHEETESAVLEKLTRNSVRTRCFVSP